MISGCSRRDGPRREGIRAVTREMLIDRRSVAIKLDLARAHEQIREMATTDALTGLQNRRTFNLATDNMLERRRAVRIRSV